MSSNTPLVENIVTGDFSEELQNKYLTYAMSTIMSRALPDVRDGLKPVHRRVLYAMRMMRLDPAKGYKKSARVVGDVIGKYHPHGDQSVYDAMVRLAQSFALRYPLVDGQGNFGSLDGDSAAAMRYTEAKMTQVAAWIMKDLENGTVDFIDNYDESDSEPVVMPSCFPNLLANGGSGIAVGLSTSIPPHNVGELCSGFVALLKTPDMRDATLLNYVKGPDFPLGGTLVEPAESIAEAYATGKGGFRLRAKWEKEDHERGQYNIVVTEIPYQVQKSRLIEKLADIVNEKKVPWLVNVCDESAENIRIVLEPKNRNVDATGLMESLFKLTDLEVRIPLNMNVLTKKGVPACLSLKNAMQHFLDHRREVLVRKSNWRSGKINDRLHLLDAYRIVYLNIDEVIEIIKENDQPAPVLMERFNLDDIQANAILDMRLRRLRKLEEMEIGREYDQLSDELKGLKEILGSYEKQTDVLILEIKAIKKEFADERRTVITDAPDVEEIPLEAMVEKEPMTVLLSKKGWVRAMKGTLADGQEAKYKEGDKEAFRIHTNSIEDIYILSSGGKVFTLPVSKLPTGRGFGEPLQLMVDLQPREAIVSMFKPEMNQHYLVASKKGYGFLIKAESLQSQTRSGKQILNLAAGDKAKFCVLAEGNLVATSSSGKRMLVFKLEELPEMGRGKGVRLMNLKDVHLESLCVCDARAGLGFKNSKAERVLTDLERWFGKRAQVGKVPPHGFTKELSFFVPKIEKDLSDIELPDYMTPQQMKQVASKIDTETLMKMATAPIPDNPKSLDLFAGMLDEEEKTEE